MFNKIKETQRVLAKAYMQYRCKHAFVSEVTGICTMCDASVYSANPPNPPTLHEAVQVWLDEVAECSGFCDCPGHDDLTIFQVAQALDKELGGEE